MNPPPLSAHPDAVAPAPPAAWRAARDFVERCRRFAVAEITRREVDGRPTSEWVSYLRFTEHTLRELDDGTLDAWFLDPAVDPSQPAPRRRP